MTFTTNLLKHSAIYSLSGVLIKLMGFILLPVYTRALTPEDFGTLALLGTFFGLFKTISTLGMQTGMIRTYLYEAETEEEKNLVLSSSYWALIVIVGLISLPPIFFASSITRFIGIDEKYAILVALMFFNNFYRLINYVRDTYFRMNQLSKKTLLWSNIEYIINLVLGIFLVVFMKMGVYGFTYAQIASLVVVSTIFLPWFLKTLRFGFSFPVFKNIFTYGIHFVLMAITSWVMNLSDRWILNLFWGTNIVGFYSIGYRFGNIFQALINGFKNQWSYSLYKMGSPENVSEILKRTLLRYLILMSILWMGLTLYIQEALILITPLEYHHTYKVVPLVSIGYILFGVSNIFSAGVHLQREAKWFWIFSSLGAAINMGLNFLFIPRYGMMAAAFTTILAFTVQPIGYYWITKKKYPVTLPWQEIIRLLFLCGIFSCISYYIFIDNLLFAFIKKTFLMILFLTTLYLSKIILPDDKKKIIQFIRSKMLLKD